MKKLFFYILFLLCTIGTYSQVTNKNVSIVKTNPRVYFNTDYIKVEANLPYWNTYKLLLSSDTAAMLLPYAPLASPTLTGTVTLPTTTSIGDVSSAEISYVNNVTSAIQPQLNARGKTATITASLSAGVETDVTLTGVTTQPYALTIFDADGLNITDAVKDSTAISGGVYHTYIYSVDAKNNAKIRILW